MVPDRRPQRRLRALDQLARPAAAPARLALAVACLLARRRARAGPPARPRARGVGSSSPCTTRARRRRASGGRASPTAAHWQPRGGGLGGARAAARLAGGGRDEPPASVQAARIGLEAIEDDVVRLAGGQYRAVLEVGSVNFGLQGEAEQEAIVAGFAAFLNGLTFPLQILVRVLPVDLERYLGRPGAPRAPRAAGAAGRAGARPRRLRAAPGPQPHAARAALLRRRAGRGARRRDGRGRGWPFGRRRRPGADAAAARRQLTFRCDEVARQLGRCGLAARRLEQRRAGPALPRLLVPRARPRAAPAPRARRVHRAGRAGRGAADEEAPDAVPVPSAAARPRPPAARARRAPLRARHALARRPGRAGRRRGRARPRAAGLPVRARARRDRLPAHGRARAGSRR